jgi:hypothetical protein
MNKAVAQQKSKGLLEYGESLEHDILVFQREAYPTRRRDWIAPRWRWMFLESAQRLGVAPMVWVYRNASGVVAHQGAIPVKLKVGTDEHITGWFVETMALESVRGKAIGPMLIKKALEDVPFNLSLGQTPKMRAIQLAMGWQHVAPLETYVLIFNQQKVFANKVRPLWLGNLAACGLSILQGSRRMLGWRRLRWIPTISEITRFDASHDRLWEEVEHEYQCIVVRDASYLNWKYVDQPGQDFVRIAVRRDEKLVAIAVVLIVEPGSTYVYRRGFLVDLIVPISDAEVIWAALEAVRKICTDRSVDLLTFYLINHALRESITSYGFFARKPTRFFLVAMQGVSTEENELMSSHKNWFITMGDSDIDRPW